MEVKTGPSEWKMRSTQVVVNGRSFVQSMVNSGGKSKGLREVLEEKGIYTKKIKQRGHDHRTKQFDEFKNEKS